MATITLIAAIGKNNELGKDKSLIWSISEDLTFFKENTIGKRVVMGMNTLNSLPKRLPNRKYIILTHKDIILDECDVVVHSLDELLEYIHKFDEEIMVIGGAQIYSLLMAYADKMLLTEIEDECDADVYFPKFSYDDWDRKVLSKHKYEKIEYRHVVYTKKIK